MLTRLIGFVVAATLGLTGGGCRFQRMYLSIEPEPVEGQFVRACELHDPAEKEGPAASLDLRPQPATMAALAAIRPPGRFCFVCRRLRRCTARVEALGLEDPDARTVAEAAGPPPQGADLPPAGGPSLERVQNRICRACASMPKRIQAGTWKPTSRGAAK